MDHLLVLRLVFVFFFTRKREKRVRRFPLAVLSVESKYASCGFLAMCKPRVSALLQPSFENKFEKSLTASYDARDRNFRGFA